MNFYNKFIALCAEARKTPTAVARDLGISKSTITNWKTRGTMATDTNLQKIASYFNVPLKDLLADSENEPATVPSDGPLSKEFALIYSQLSPERQKEVDRQARLLLLEQQAQADGLDSPA